MTDFSILFFSILSYWNTLLSSYLLLGNIYGWYSVRGEEYWIVGRSTIYKISANPFYVWQTINGYIYIKASIYLIWKFSILFAVSIFFYYVCFWYKWIDKIFIYILTSRHELWLCINNCIKIVLRRIYIMKTMIMHFLW